MRQHCYVHFLFTVYVTARAHHVFLCHTKQLNHRIVDILKADYKKKHVQKKIYTDV